VIREERARAARDAKNRHAAFGIAGRARIGQAADDLHGDQQLGGALHGDDPGLLEDIRIDGVRGSDLAGVRGRRLLPGGGSTRFQRHELDLALACTLGDGEDAAGIMQPLEVHREHADVDLLDQPARDIEQVHARLVADADDIGAAEPARLQVAADGATQRTALAHHGNGRVPERLERKRGGAKGQHGLFADRPDALAVGAKQRDVVPLRGRRKFDGVLLAALDLLEARAVDDRRADAERAALRNDFRHRLRRGDDEREVRHLRQVVD
jgi:hypothetical protein